MCCFLNLSRAADFVKIKMAGLLTPEVEDAVDDIVNEAFVVEDDQPAVQINLERTKFSDTIKKTIHEEFEEILHLMDFQKEGQDLFRRWYNS